MSQPFLTDSPMSDVPKTCPLCSGDDSVTDYDTGEEICINCGCVINDHVMMKGITAIDYDFKAPTLNLKHHGLPQRHSIYDYGMNTFMTGKIDGMGAPIKPETMKNMRRLQKRDNQSKTNESVARNLSVAMSELDRMSTTLNIPDHIKERAAVIYRRALKKDLIRGRSIDAFVAAALYAACRMNAIPRPLKNVASESKRTYKEVSMTYRMLMVELNLKPPIDKPLKYVPELAHNLNIPRPTEMRAISLLMDANREKALVGKDPRGVAAAALYLASELNGERIVQSLVARAAETTEVTLRNRYRGLKKALSIV